MRKHTKKTRTEQVNLDTGGSERQNLFLGKVYSHNTCTENGAISHSTTGNVFTDYFSKCGTYRGREVQEVFADVSSMWAESPGLTMKIILYSRLISRQTKGFFSSSTVQKGMGNRDEFYKSVLWLARYQKEFLNRHLWMIPLVGSWKDLWCEELLGELDTVAVYETVKRGMENPYNRELLAKYLPRMRSKSNCHNGLHVKLHLFALGLCKYLKWSPIEYRKFKASGKAHDFQRKMCSGNARQMDLNSIPGKAMFNLVNNHGLKDNLTFFERHGLEEKCLEWIDRRQEVNFTGYVHELMKAVGPGMSRLQKLVVDRQFDRLMELGSREGKIENVWCALDTSGSMRAEVVKDVTAFDICISLGIYFSGMNRGAFKDHVIMFDAVSRVKKLYGNSFSDKVLQITSSETAWGNTDFQSVIDEIVRIRVQNPEIPVTDYPQTLLVVSDMQFDPVADNKETNYDTAMWKLKSVGLDSIQVIWWYVCGRGKDFPSQISDRGVTLIGGFDGFVITSLMKGEKVIRSNQNIQDGLEQKRRTPFENMMKVMEQEVLSLVE